ncbi:hypothetical protein OQ968_08515 [Mycobacterium sp. 663a-19]|uniref:hypothetical protein n=1 Tax=Mycobacterium sp. 663a-19 TaxID=2986148 RepID=UPI002D1EE35F|nr:hypothetical protein [Mycobacterium sp. 663a-19]MEB3981301.1 hypothetical protein [Mycobacterium sp. 663a-19]
MPICGIDEVVKVVQGEVRRPLAVFACVACAAAALLLAFMAGWDLYLTGFPDSHFTDYDKAAAAPKRILMWAEWGFVVLFLILGFSPIGTRARIAGLLVALAALVLVAAVQLLGIPWYFITHLGLDNGTGG